MEIKQFTWEVVDSNSWLIIEDNAGLLIDAIDSGELRKASKELDQLTVILTHSHFDHICGLNKIREIKPDVKVISTNLCSEYLGDIYKNMSSSATAFICFYNGRNDVKIDPITCTPSDIVFEKTKSFYWKGHSVNLLAVYGHSADGLIVVIDNKLLFSGDTLLPDPTVTRFPTGSTKRFWEEDMPKLKNIDVDRVYPGHGACTDLKSLIIINERQKENRRIKNLV